MTLWMPHVLSMTTQVRPIPAPTTSNPPTPPPPSAHQQSTHQHQHNTHMHPSHCTPKTLPHLPTSNPPPNTHHSTLQWCAHVGTDTLLCHDDQLEGRRVAFIYYLVPPTWSEEDGGTLDLYSTDGSCMCHAPPSSGSPTPSPSLACSKSAARQGGPVTPPKVEHLCLL